MSNTTFAEVIITLVHTAFLALCSLVLPSQLSISGYCIHISIVGCLVVCRVCVCVWRRASICYKRKEAISTLEHLVRGNACLMVSVTKTHAHSCVVPCNARCHCHYCLLGNDKLRRLPFISLPRLALCCQLEHNKSHNTAEHSQPTNRSPCKPRLAHDGSHNLRAVG